MVGLVGVAVGRFRVVLVAIVTLGVVVVRGARRGRPGAPPTWKTIPSTSALMSLKAKASHTQSEFFRTRHRTEQGLKKREKVL